MTLPAARFERIDPALLPCMDGPALEGDPVLDRALDLLGEVYDRERGFLRYNPLDWLCLTEAQAEMLADVSPEALWCDGNQVGKSLEQAVDILDTARGTHVFQENRQVPVEIVVVSVSFEQMEPLMAKIWELVPKDEIDLDSVGFVKGRGITGKPPRIELVSGPGKGSVIKFATYAQGSKRIAGITADMVCLDEPPTEDMYGEVRPRLLRKRGKLRVTMTPTPGMPEQSWYKRRVEKGEVSFHNHGLSEASVTPKVWRNSSVGAWVDNNLTAARAWPRPFLTQAEIDTYEEGLPEIERGMRMNGDWDPGVVGHWLPSFHEPTHVRRVEMRDLAGWYLAVGLDHGTQDGKQAAMLVAIQDRGKARPKVRWLAETVAVDENGDGYMTRPEDDARNIVRMLASRGLTWEHVDLWVGDVPAGSLKHEVKKSNRLVRQEMALYLDIPVGRIPAFSTPKKGHFSMTYGVAFLNTLFGRYDDDGTPHALVDPRCKHFIQFCKKFDGDKFHPTKDVGDAGRYPVERAVARRRTA